MASHAEKGWKMNTKNEAKGRWYGILSQFIESEYLTGKHTRCPICGGVDRFRWDNKDDNGGYYCNSCGSGSGIHLLSQHQGIGYPDAWRLVEKVIGTVKLEVKKVIDESERVREILSGCEPGGDFVKNYLISRGLNDYPESLFKGVYWLEGEKHEAIIARASKGNKLAGIHATFIKNGIKIARRMYAMQKGSMTGSAIRLHMLNGGDALVIGEGIETSLSAAEITGLPAWAAMDSGKLETVEIPDQVKRIVIAADNDYSYTGQAAAYALAKRLKLAGKIVEVIMPEIIGEDFNDEIKRKIRP